MTDLAATPPLLAAATAMLPDVLEIRRLIHRQPERGLQLPLTQELIVHELERLGLAPTRGNALTSVTALIEGASPGPTILLRADMDALPLTEDTDLPFVSEIAGTMHACGHDTHVAMLLGAARLLAERREQLAGRVLLMFQPGEEGFHGARSMLEEGLLDESAHEAVTGAFAIHISTRYPTGTIHLRPGPMLAAGDTIRITVLGRGGHASTPQLAVDPITVAAEIVLALQVMVTRRVDAFEPAVLTIANISAGTTTNIIPETAFIQGTMRTVSEEVRERVRGYVRQVAEGVAAAHGATVDVELEPGYPVTVNDPGFTSFVTQAATDLIGPKRVVTLDAPDMGSEDMSYVLQRVPGTIVFLGARPSELDPLTAPQNHSNRVEFDEAAMAVGIALYAEVATRHLAPSGH